MKLYRGTYRVSPSQNVVIGVRKSRIVRSETGERNTCCRCESRNGVGIQDMFFVCFCFFVLSSCSSNLTIIIMMVCSMYTFLQYMHGVFFGFDFVLWVSWTGTLVLCGL